MDKVIEELVKKADPWVVDLLLLSIALLIGVWVFATIRSINRSVMAYATADKVLEFTNKCNKLEREVKEWKDRYGQSHTIISGIKGLYEEARYLLYQFAAGNDIQGEGQQLLRSIADRISTDLKFSGGERHRCAIWVNVDDTNLGMTSASCGFPDHHRMIRHIPIDKSIAGRCYRTKLTINSGDVQSDRDYLQNNGASSQYQSMICIPVVFGDFCLGVITIDGREVNTFSEQNVEAAETYTEIVAMVLMMQIINAQLEQTQGEVAAYDEQEE